MPNRGHASRRTRQLMHFFFFLSSSEALLFCSGCVLCSSRLDAFDIALSRFCPEYLMPREDGTVRHPKNSHRDFPILYAPPSSKRLQGRVSCVAVHGARVGGARWFVRARPLVGRLVFWPCAVLLSSAAGRRGNGNWRRRQGQGHTEQSRAVATGGRTPKGTHTARNR
jgi:hypothetical protein